MSLMERIIFAEEMSPEYGDMTIADKVLEAKKAAIEHENALKEASLESNKPFNQEFMTRKDAVIAAVIGDVKKSLREPNFFVSPIEVFQVARTKFTEDYAGFSHIIHVELVTIPGVVADLAAYEQLNALAHEIYHFLPSAKFRLAYPSEKEVSPALLAVKERKGLIYGTKANQVLPTKHSEGVRSYPDYALEEGLAQSMQVKMRPVLESIFPEIAQEKQNLVNELVRQGHIPEDVPPELVRISAGDSTDSTLSVSLISPHGYYLVKFLEAEIANFDTLVERARIHHETLGLARAIEAKFGTGSYKKIVTASLSEAKELLEELREKIQERE